MEGAYVALDREKEDMCPAQQRLGEHKVEYYNMED
jgi:hypothetical protein